jgi:hypothetical protein
MAERPDRYRNAIVPHIYVDGASDAIAFYNKAFGAALVHSMVPNPASLRDPLGHVWVLMPWKADFDAAEIQRRGKALMSVT